MERLTRRNFEGEAIIPYRYTLGEAVDQLCEIEDILGDTYDLSRLKELVVTDREGRCVEVVRCKDCKYFLEIPMSIPVCSLIDYKFRKLDDFCSYGKREAAEKALEDKNG